MRLAVALWIGMAGLAWADDASVVRMHAVYLDAPTEWCAAEDGVPAVVTIDGPDLHTGEPVETARVKVRRGLVLEDIEIARTDLSELRIRKGTESRTQERLRPREGEIFPLGRFFGEVRLCESFWNEDMGQIVWEVRKDDGAVVLTDRSDLQYWERRRHPIFGWSAYNSPASFKLGDEKVVVMTALQIETTFETRVSPAEEQDQ